MKKPKFKTPKSLKRPFKRPKKLPPAERAADAFASVPRITNDTIAEHREEVLGSARKYIYPLQHSKHRVVRISVSLFVAVVIVFFAYCGLALYKLQSTSAFIYGVTQVIPFPVAKAGHAWVSYDSYLFELRRNIHYYQTQQQANFSTKAGRAQLARLKEQAMAQVIQNAYVKQLAIQNHISVSSQDVTNEVTLVRSQNRLGSSNQVFDAVLNQFWGWNEADFKQELQQQLLQQAVVAKLDTTTTDHAKTVYKQVQAGADFATLAAQNTDNAATRTSGGQYPAPISKNDQTLAPQVLAELFKLKAGQISPIINTGYSLEIVKAISVSNNSVQAAHIAFNFHTITTYTKPLQAKAPIHHYIKV